MPKKTNVYQSISKEMGTSKHYKSGHTVNSKHFTGTKAGKRVRRKGLSRKERKLKRRKHINKYKQK